MRPNQILLFGDFGDLDLKTKQVDLTRSIKPEIMARCRVFVARSIKVYRFLSTKRLSEIYTAIKSVKDSQGTSGYPQIANIKQNSEEVNGSLHIRKKVNGAYETLYYEFTIKKSGILFLQGKTVGRTDVTELLTNWIEPTLSRHDIVKERTLSNGEMLRIFANLTKQHGRNIISELKVTFNPISGYTYVKENYEKLAFKFVENRCASEHRNFDEFLENSKEVEMWFGLLKCTGLEKELRNNHTTLIVKSDCSFRMFKEVPHENWLTFIHEVLNFF